MSHAMVTQRASEYVFARIEAGDDAAETIGKVTTSLASIAGLGYAMAWADGVEAIIAAKK